MGEIVAEIEKTEELEKALRRCEIKCGHDLFPYQDSEITVQRVAIEDLVPLAKYVLQENLERIGLLHDRLNLKGFDIFDLSGRLNWWDDNSEGLISPPIVEFWADEGYLLVDGLHRVFLAREKGRSTINCVVIRDVTTPLVPLPTSWDKIRIYPSGETPETDDKRDFRFSDKASLQNAMPEFRAKVTDENYRYFLYRDLSALGSTGIRETRDNNITDGD